MHIRSQFHYLDTHSLHLKNAEGIPFCVQLTPKQEKHLRLLGAALTPSTSLQLLSVEPFEEDKWVCEWIVYEPDFLLDISALAECVKPYGSHPLTYSWQRMRKTETTRYLLLGNVANYFMDRLLHAEDIDSCSYESLMKDFFTQAPLELSACADLQQASTEKDFFMEAKKQFTHLKEVVKNYFPQQGIVAHEVVVEPSFINNSLGLQGRLDLMMPNYSSFVELKSGKAIEEYRTQSFIRAQTNHYAQMILYLAVLEFSKDLQPQEVASYLLYSRYPVLSREKHDRAFLLDLLELRNSIVALEYLVQANNSAAYTRLVLQQIRSEVLNTLGMNDRFYRQYLAPSIDAFQQQLQSLDRVEQQYLYRLYTFIVKEIWHTKLGVRSYEGIARKATLWHASDEEKIAAGEFLYDLHILPEASNLPQACISFHLPDYPNHYTPNFREGDVVVLYEWNGSRKLGEGQVFKASIASLGNQQISLRLRYPQHNHASLPLDSTYALEHDYLDVTYAGMCKGLLSFAQATQERRDLLLGRRAPAMPLADSVTEVEGSATVATVVQKALAAQDCFLLLGPPGTGKTSQALKQLVENLYAQSQSVLLMAYTNRAVDEICAALLSIQADFPFIRLGSELSCAEEYRPYLLEKTIAQCSTRKQVQAHIQSKQIFVGTVASLSNRTDLFTLKQFDVAIVDEASQLVEPLLLPILSAATPQGKNLIKKFVLIGDHKQLPAVLLQTLQESRVEEEELREEVGMHNLNESLFERLYRLYNKQEWSYAYGMLDQQGRMHPDLCAFPSSYFYQGKLRSLALPHQLPQASLLSPLPKRLCYLSSPVDLSGYTAKTNVFEAEMVANFVEDLVHTYELAGEAFTRQTLGVITPYRSQIALIKRQLEEKNIPQSLELVVDTVERFQGGQKDIIVYSFCLNAAWQLNNEASCIVENGQLIDRKLNVVLTRARKQLLLIGNRELLLQNPLYAQLLHYLEAQDE